MGEGKQGEGGDGKETSLFKGGGIDIIKARCITGYLLMALGMVTLGTPCAATLKGTQGQVMEAHHVRLLSRVRRGRLWKHTAFGKNFKLLSALASSSTHL